MDHRLLSGSGNRREEGDVVPVIDGRMELAGSSLPRRNPSRSAREVSTRSQLASGAARDVKDEMAAHDDSFSELQGNSLSSFPARSSSWDSNSISGDEGDDAPSGEPKKDRRKFVDVTTPTLVDEFDEEEEAEMVSLEQEHLRHSHFVMAKDDSHLRRTPGANMYASAIERSAAHRRTPGASAMHESAVAPSVVTPAAAKITGGDGSVLGFGLTLSTPVGIDERPGKSKRADDDEESGSYSSSSVSASAMEHGAAPQDRPPLVPNAATQGRDVYSYTPAGLTLSKNPNLEFSRGAFSPNTIRLTESLDNLLLDDDDNNGAAATKKASVPQSSSRVVFGSATFNEDEASESWTKSYIFDNDGGKATMSKMPKTGSSRNRRGRNDASKRNKGFSVGQGNSGPLFRPQQPKPVRQTPPTGVADSFGVNRFLQPASGGDKNTGFSGEDDDRSSPRPLNFGGAFVPTKANLKNFKRPLASVRGPTYEASVAAASLPQQGVQTLPTFSAAPTASGRPAYQPLGGPHPAMIHQQHYSGFERGAPFAATPQPFVPDPMSGPVGHSPVPGQDVHFHAPPGMDYHGHGFGPPIGMSANSAMGPPSMNPYTLSPPIGMPYGQDYHPQQPPAQHFPPPAWGHVSPMHFDATAGAHRNPAWPNTGGTGWVGVGNFVYGMPVQTMEHPHAMSLSPPSPGFPYHDNDPSSGVEHVPPSNAHMYPIEAPDQGMLMETSGRRPRVRSADSLSPATVPIQGRGRMKSWDHGSRDTTIYGKKEGQRRSTQRRQRQSEMLTKTRAHAKNKKNSTSEDKFKSSDATVRKKSAPASPRKKKPTKGRVISPSESLGGPKQKSSSVGAKKEGTGADAGRVTPSMDDPVDQKRAELVESPETRLAFKTFYRSFRVKERSSFQEAEEFALENLKDDALPENVRWRVYLELADLAKRANRFDEARRLYQKVCELQPYASQGWLEYSKLEEECGHLNRCSRILRNGLENCELSESLLTRAIKHEEKMGNIGHARQLLARLKHVGIEKVWRTVLEGALLEARAGNDVMARRVLKYLMHHVPWYGPLYLEAYRLERDLGRPLDALAIVERGLKAIPRYGPLWFGAFRLCEALDLSEKTYDLPRTLAMFDRAVVSISRELVWKVHLDAAQILERAAIKSALENPAFSSLKLRSMSRQRFARTVLACPPNLCWKVWLAGGRMELAAGNTSEARRLFLRAHVVVPEKGRAAVLLERARLEEFVDNSEVARAILNKTRSEVGSDWKVWLESVLVEIRSGEHRRAIELAEHALEVHSGTGRLWAALVQLRQTDGEEAQYSALKNALRAVPKSGEVWCEGARIHLNPFSHVFDVDRARRHLLFATKFTPQYGDSFLETLRLELMEKWISPVASRLWEALKNSRLKGKALSEAEGDEIDQFVVTWVLVAVRSIFQPEVPNESSTNSADEIDGVIDPELVASCRDSLNVKTCSETVDLSEVELRCANADPNYGLLWFHCRQGPTDTARVVLDRAREKIVNEMSKNAHIYVAAAIRRSGIVAALKTELQKQAPDLMEAVTDVSSEASKDWDKLLTKKLLSSPSVETILREASVNEHANMVLVEKSTLAADFITGLVELNKFTPLQSMSLQQRRKTLFGSDSLLS